MILPPELMKKYPDAIAFTFGDSRVLCERLNLLVRTKIKTATCGAMRDFDNTEPLPKVGRCDIALSWDGVPELIIRTTDVHVCEFRDVEEKFALCEGENSSLAGWRRDHKAYFARNGGWREDMKLVCENFELVQDLALNKQVGDQPNEEDGRR